MSRENVEIVRRWLGATADWMNSGNERDELDRIGAQFTAPDVVFEEDPVWPDAGAFRGRDAVFDRVAEYLDLMHIRRVTLGEVIDAGEVVVAEVRIEMLGDAGGEPVGFLWTYTVAVEDGRVAHLRAWYNADEALEAAGLKE